MRRVGAGILLTAAFLTPSVAEAAPQSCGLVAHRGDHTSHSENSLGSIRAAVVTGADYVEVDVRVSSHGTLFLMHDRRVDRTTNGVGAIENMTDAQVRSLRLGDGSRIPTLAAALQEAAPTTLEVLVELKVALTTEANRTLVRLLRGFGRARVRVTSFVRLRLEAVTALAPGLPQGIVTTTALTPEQVAPYDSVLIQFPAVTDDWLASMPYPVFVWTPDAIKQWDAVATKVQAVITDRPGDFQEYRQVSCSN